MGRILTLLAIALFGGIGLFAFFSRDHKPKEEKPVEIVVGPANIPEVPPACPPPVVVEPEEALAAETFTLVDRMDEFFNVGLPKLPIVETVSYSSRAPFVTGRPAWITDYANHYKTSRHFIARSLNKGPDYERQNISNGDRFNVFKEDKPISFHMVVDTSECTLFLYYFDEETNERVLVKSCQVGLGRPDTKKASGMLTPKGTYTLGDKIAVYRPGTTGLYNKEKVEMVEVFGTRWIPFGDEVEKCTEPAKGFGIHGCPLVASENGELVEDTSGLGRYESDGCIRMLTKDIEEIFAVIITKPSTLYIVAHKDEAHVPGKEGQVQRDSTFSAGVGYQPPTLQPALPREGTPPCEPLPQEVQG